MPRIPAECAIYCEEDAWESGGFARCICASGPADTPPGNWQAGAERRQLYAAKAYAEASTVPERGELT